MRTGRNYRFAAGGHAATAAIMGLVGAYFQLGMIFVAAAALCIPALIALAFIQPNEIDYARARNAATGKQAPEIGHVFDLLKNHGLVLFTAAPVLFQLATRRCCRSSAKAWPKRKRTRLPFGCRG